MSLKNPLSSLFHILQRPPRFPPYNWTSIHERYPSDICAVLPLRLAGFYVKEKRLALKRQKFIIFAAAVVSPLAVAPFLQLAEPKSLNIILPYFGWLVWFSCLTFLTVLCAWQGCKIFYDLTGDLEMMLTGSGITAYHRWADRRTRLGPQARTMVIGAAASVVALWMISGVPDMKGDVYITAASYLAVALTGAMVAGVAYWGGHGTMLARRLSQPGRLRLTWVAPSRTPGLEALARCYRYGFYLTAIGSAACLTPILSWAYGSPSSTYLKIVKTALLLIPLLVTTLIAIAPQYWLSMAVSRARRETLVQLMAKLPVTSAEVNLGDRELSTLQGLIKLVSDSPSSTVSDRTIVAILLGISFAAAPSIVQIVRG